MSPSVLEYPVPTAAYSPNSGSGNIAVSSAQAMGTSWFSGFGNSNLKYEIPNRIARLICPGGLDNYAQAGSSYSDIAANGGAAKVLRNFIPDQIAGPYSSAGGFKMLVPPVNDAAYFGQGALASALVERSFTAVMGAIVAARQINNTDAAITNIGAGNGTAGDGTVCMGTGYRYSTINGSGFRITLDNKFNQKGMVLYFPQFRAFACTALATIAINGVTYTTYDQAPDNAQAITAVKDFTQGIFIPGSRFNYGINTVDITYTNLSGPNFGTFNGAVICGDAPVLVLKYPRRNPDAIAGAGGTALDISMAWGNARATNVMANFPKAFFVDTAPVLSPNFGTANAALDERKWFDFAHPNDEGDIGIVNLCMDQLSVRLAGTAGAMSDYDSIHNNRVAAAAITPAATTAAATLSYGYTQAQADSIPTRINAIITALQNIGVTL